MIERCAQILVAGGHVLVFALHRGEGDVVIVLGYQLVSARPRGNTAVAAVVAHAIHGDVVNHRFVVDVGDVGVSDVGDRTIVEEVPASPVASFEANTTVPVSIVDSTVKADVRPPIAFVPEVGAFSPTPIPRCPQQARGRSGHPGAGHPIVVPVAIGPVAGSPDVAHRRASRLHIDGKCGRGNVDRDPDGYESERRQRE
jgi:hypothetical protein